MGCCSRPPLRRVGLLVQPRTGAQRETVMFEGDALSPANKPQVEQMQMESFRRGALAGSVPRSMPRSSSAHDVVPPMR